MLADMLRDVVSVGNGDVDDDRIDVAIGKRINFNAYGLRAEILGETAKAWRARTPAGG